MCTITSGQHRAQEIAVWTRCHDTRKSSHRSQHHGIQCIPWLRFLSENLLIAKEARARGGCARSAGRAGMSEQGLPTRHRSHSLTLKRPTQPPARARAPRSRTARSPSALPAQSFPRASRAAAAGRESSRPCSSPRPAQQKVPQKQTPHWSWRKTTLCPRPAGSPPSASDWGKS